MDTTFSYTEKDRGFFSSDELKWINRIRKLKEQYPDRVRIIRQPEDNDGCIYCQLPSEWLKVQPKLVRNMTDEQRAAASARMKELRERQGLN